MYQQKFMPYNKMNDVYEQQQFQEEDSQPLIEEVDPDYQPTQRQVRQYAVQILGMNLPEDERLLYLAKEGLKAPIPTNWQPFQGKDGQVYYKHKITQQKTYEHPTDVQYRKKYIQQKQRVARKNLKSMSLKSNPLTGIGQGINNYSLGLGIKAGINPLGLSNLSSQSHQAASKQISKLDPQFQVNLQRQYEELQQKLKRQLKQFQTSRKQQHQKNMKKYKNEFQNSLSELKSQKSSISSYEKSLKQQKQRIKQRLGEAYQDRFKDQLIQIQKQQQSKYHNVVELFEDQNKIKFKKYQSEKQKQFEERQQKLQLNEKKHEQNKKINAKKREKTISQIKQKLQEEDNKEIQQATKQTFQTQLSLIIQKNANKIKQFEEKLQNQYLQMKKLLGHDPNQILQQMAEKRNRLKRIAEQKLQSLKKKQYQKVNQSYSQQLQKSIKQINLQLQTQSVKQLQTHKSSTQAKLENLKNQLEKQHNQMIIKKTQQLYCSLKKSTNEYQKDKNKKILEIRQKFISEIVQKNQFKSEELNIRLNAKDKQQMIQNKQQLIQSLKRQLQLERFVLKDLKMNKNIVTSNNIDGELKKLMTQMNIIYKPDSFLKHQKVFNQLKVKYKNDKQLLGSMMSQLQNSSFLGLTSQISGQNQRVSSTTSVLIKQYNKDVRVMRQNEQMLSKYQLILRKCELNDQNAIKDLEKQMWEYKQISLRNNMQLNSFSNQTRLNQIQSNGQNLVQRKTFYGTNNSYQSVEDTLKQHSKFLSTVKAELNRKLYKVRSNNYYRV